MGEIIRQANHSGVWMVADMAKRRLVETKIAESVAKNVVHVKQFHPARHIRKRFLMLRHENRRRTRPLDSAPFQKGRTPAVWRLLTSADRALIGIALCCAVGLGIFQRFHAAPGRQVWIEVDGELVGVYAFQASQLLRIAGPLGITQVEIGAPGARIADAPCPHKSCMRQGWVRRGGEALICVPNRLVVAVVGGSERTPVDAVSR